MRAIQNLKGEVWKQLSDFSGYLISNMGRIKSTKCNREKIMTATNRRGYGVTTLTCNCRSKVMAVHTLVLITFVGLPTKAKPKARHKNGNTMDSRLENLEWASTKKCHSHRVIPKFPLWRDIPCSERKEYSQAKLTKEDVRYIRASTDTRQSLANKFGIGIGVVFAVRARKTWKWVD